MDRVDAALSDDAKLTQNIGDSEEVGDALAARATDDENITAMPGAHAGGAAQTSTAGPGVSVARDADAKINRTVFLDGRLKSESIVFGSRTMTGDSVEPVVSSRPAGFSIAINIPGFFKTTHEHDGEEFNLIRIPGWSRLQEIGRPAVPVKTIMLEIPHGVTPHVALTVLAQAKIAPLNILPAQPPLPDVRPEPPRPPFQRDAVVYDSNNLFPASRLFDHTVGNLRNRRILTIMVTPMQVRPLSRTALIAENMRLEVTFTADAPADAGEAGDAAPADGGGLPDGYADGVPGKYMILMDDQFTDNATLADFAEWKRRKGYDVSIVKTSDIDPGGAPTNGQIVAYMRGLPVSDYPEYLLIIGDHTADNGVEGTYFSTSDGGWTDLYIACRDDADFLPDLYHGRLPASNTVHLTTMLGNVLMMDRTPPIHDAYNKICVAGQIQDSDDTNNVADRLFCETADLIANYFEQDPAGVGYACGRAVVNPDGVTSNCRWNEWSLLWNPTDEIGNRVWQHFIGAAAAKTRVISNVNAGVALLQHRDHGYSGGHGWADPQLISSDVRAFTNGAKLPVVFSVNCASGAYQHDRFLRAWFQNTNGGAYAVFAPVDISYSWLNDWLTHGFYAGFLTNYIAFQNTCADPAWPKHLPAPGGVYGAAGSATRLGAILNFGKMYMGEHYSLNLTTFRLFHLFGDPESFIHVAAPVTQAVTHAATLPAGAATLVVSNLTVGAQVCLYSAGLGIHQVTNAAGDTAAFGIFTADTGTVHVTVTAYGARPYQGMVDIGGAIMQFSAAQCDVVESDGGVWITVLRSGNTAGAATVDFAATAGTADAGADFTATNGTLTFADGVVSNGFAIEINTDADPEEYETIDLQLRNPGVGVALGTQSNAVVRIEDDDSAGQLYLSAAAYSMTESGGMAVISVLRANGANGTVSVAFSAAAGTAGAGDFVATNGVLEFAPGVVSNYFEVSITDDHQDESDETILIALGDPAGGATLASPSNAVLTIVDDDMGGILALASAAYSVSERDAELRVWVQRAGGGDGVVSVEFAVSNGTALAGADYQATNGILTLSHGMLSNSFTVEILNQPDGCTNETFTVYLDNAAGGAGLGAPASALVTILDAALILLEDFESQMPPVGWTQEYMIGTTDWECQAGGGPFGGGHPAAAHGGNSNACLFANTTNDHVTRLITPALDCAPYTDAELTFWHCMESWVGQDELRVYYRTTADGAWNLLAAYTNHTAEWTMRTIRLEELGHSYYIAFEGNARKGYGVCLDDVVIMGGGTNPPPDETPPGVPAGLAMTARTVDRIVIGWNASTDNVGVAGYQVYRNGALVGDVAGLVYTNTGLSQGVVYTNQVRAYDAAGNYSALSAGLAVTTLQAVAITVQPQSQTNFVGYAVAFTVAATGTEPIFYQWHQDANPLAGAVTPAFNIDAIQAGDAGEYVCVVSNEAGAVTSQTAVLAVVSPLPAPPAGVMASDGAFADKVAVAWLAARQAGSYEIWRGTHLNTNAAVKIGEITGTAYDDFSAAAAPGVMMYYWVKTKTAAGTSGFSASDSGWCAVGGQADLALTGFLLSPVRLAPGAHPARVALLLLNNGPDAMANCGVAMTFAMALIASAGAGPEREIGAYATNITLAAGAATVLYPPATAITLPADAAGDYRVHAAVCHTSGFTDPDVHNNTTARAGGIGVGAGSGPAMPLACDFDGDGRADPALYWEDAGAWTVWLSSIGWRQVSVSGMGGSDGLPAPGDFDGDGRQDPAVYDAWTGTWTAWLSHAGYQPVVFQIGGMGCVPVAGRFTAQPCDEPAVYQTIAGQWRILPADGIPVDVEFGGDADRPAAGDFDGDGLADLVLYNISEGVWQARCSAGGYGRAVLSGLGGAGYDPVAADYDGDGWTDPAVYHAATGTWVARLSASGYPEVRIVDFGGPDCVPAPGDFDGDGKADLAVHDYAVNAWFLRLSGSGYAPLRISAIYGE